MRRLHSRAAQLIETTVSPRMQAAAPTHLQHRQLACAGSAQVVSRHERRLCRLPEAHDAIGRACMGGRTRRLVRSRADISHAHAHPHPHQECTSCSHAARVALSRHRTVSSSPDATSWPSGDQATLMTESECPRNAATCMKRLPPAAVPPCWRRHTPAVQSSAGRGPGQRLLGWSHVLQLLQCRLCSAGWA